MTNFERAVGRMNLRKTVPAPAVDELRELGAAATRIDIIIAVFALGVLFGTVIA